MKKQENINGGEIQESKVSPKKVDLYLNTYYPGRYPYYIGHSELLSSSKVNPIVISSVMSDDDYNLVTNNCADHTGRFLKYALKRDFKPVLFTTPGDVRDFIKQDTLDSKSYKGLYRQHIQVPFLDYQLARNKYMSETYGDKFKPYTIQPFRTAPTSRNYAKWDSGYRHNRDGTVYNIYQDNPDIDMPKNVYPVWENIIASYNMRNEGWREHSGKWYPEEEYNALFYLTGGSLPLVAKSGIHIKKKNRGKFTVSAKEHGMEVQEYATKVLNDPNATPLQKRRAQFAKNSTKFKHN